MSRRVPDPGQPQGTEENFLQRWSRRKSTAREASEPGESIGDVAVESAGPASADAQGPTTGPVAPVEAAPLPDLDQLDQDSDYSAFLAPGVDAALRRKALRKLFHSPKFNVCDGLDDYCDDFTVFAPLSAGVVTADMRHHMERAARKLAEQLEEPVVQGPTVAGTQLEPETQGDQAPPQVEGTKEDDDHGPA